MGEGVKVTVSSLEISIGQMCSSPDTSGSIRLLAGSNSSLLPSIVLF